MYCSECGKEIKNNQKFCCYCGTENEICVDDNKKQIYSDDVHIMSSTKSQTDTEFNRDVINNYLFNVQTLEFAKYGLSEEQRDLNNRINSLGHKKIIVKNQADVESSIGVVVIMCIIFGIALIVNTLINGDGFISIFDDLLNPIVTIIMVISVPIAVIFLFVAISEIMKDKERYANEVIYEKQRLQNESVEKEELLNILSTVEYELEQTENLLNEAYSINILPDKYRNLGAVNFIYKNMSTSIMKFEEICFHCDLDEISKKLDIIIEQQMEIIMKLACTNALNEQIVRQNEQILSHAIKTERNTERISQYSQVAAINSNTVAQIQTYNFYKNGL